MLCGAVFASDIDIASYKSGAGELKKSLVGELKAKLAEGAPSAVEFCSKRAMELTESVSKKHSLKIKRVSEKSRNPQNTPDATDKKALEEFARMIKTDGKPSEYLVVDGRYYEPLMTNEACVICHGKEESISKETTAKIKALYPNDKAVGYGVGELRGAIVVTK